MILDQQYTKKKKEHELVQVIANRSRSLSLLLYVAQQYESLYLIFL